MGLTSRQLVLALGDISSCLLGLFAALCLRQFSIIPLGIYLAFLTAFLPSLVVWALTMYALGLYDFRGMRDLIGLLQDMLWAAVINTASAIALFYALYPYHGLTPKTHLLLASLLAHIGFFTWRHLWVRVYSSKLLVQRVALMGEGSDPLWTEICEDVRIHPQLGYRLVPLPEVALPNPRASGEPWRPVSSAGRELRAAADLVVVDAGKPHSKPERFRALFTAAVAAGVPVMTHLDFYEQLYRRIPPHHAAKPDWLLTYVLPNQQQPYAVLKRWLDILGSLLGLVLFSPLFLLVSVMSLLDGGGPFYFQRRFGFKGREFNICKLRTMRPGADKGGPLWHVPREDGRVTRLGRILRRLRLDELPQLWNVLKGDMSLVGPRPEWTAEVEVLEKTVPHYHLRHLVKPGMTGWAQINFRATNDPEDSFEKLQYDLYYVKHFSLALDIGILLKTLKRVFVKDEAFFRHSVRSTRPIPSPLKPAAELP